MRPTAASTLAVGTAEAEAMDKRAEAFAHYNDAAVLQMLIEVLPQIAREVAAPMAAIDQLTVISTDGAGALPRQVNDNVVQTLTMLKTATGLDLEALIKQFIGLDGRRADEQRRPSTATWSGAASREAPRPARRGCCWRAAIGCCCVPDPARPAGSSPGCMLCTGPGRSGTPSAVLAAGMMWSNTTDGRVAPRSGPRRRERIISARSPWMLVVCSTATSGRSSGRAKRRWIATAGSKASPRSWCTSAAGGRSAPSPCRRC